MRRGHVTPRSLDVLRAILAIHARTGWMPNVREIADELELSSPGTVQKYLTKLEAADVIERKHRDSEQYRVTDLGRSLVDLMEPVA